jgi:hypothetical protein
VVALVALAALLRPGDDAAPAGAQEPNTMAVDADPSTEAIDTSASRVVAEEFDVSTNIAAVGTHTSLTGC